MRNAHVDTPYSYLNQDRPKPDREEWDRRLRANQPGSIFDSRIGDTIATQAGRMWFIVLHALWFPIWIGLNAGFQGALRFDPFPYALLTMIVSLESIFLSLFILMSQNRSGLQAEQRNHLDLQINLLSEDENTKKIQMLQAICEHLQLPIAADVEIKAMSKRTELQNVLAELKDSLPGGQ